MKKRETKQTFTKKWTQRILWISLIDLQLPFILAFLDKTEIAESLATAIVTEIIGVTIGYMLKSYFETKAEKKQEYEYRRLEMNYDDEDAEEEE